MSLLIKMGLSIQMSLLIKIGLTIQMSLLIKIGLSIQKSLLFKIGLSIQMSLLINPNHLCIKSFCTVKLISTPMFQIGICTGLDSS